MDKPTAIDLFCGCGGLTLGLKESGFKVIAAVDNNFLSIETYKANHPEVEVFYTDVRLLSVATLKRKLKMRKRQLDLLAGCPPCQGFSTMRTLNGSRVVKDPRNDLLFEFQRFVEALLPKIVMMENVPGLASDKRFSKFCKRLKDLGYEGDYKILNAADYGVPQRRRRLLYLAGYKKSIEFASEKIPKRTVRDAIYRLPEPGKSGDLVHDVQERRTLKTTELIKKIPKDGGSRTDLPVEEQLECHKRCNGFKDVYGRMTWDDVAPTITSGCFNPSKGRFLHPEQNRAITLREASILQGFPKDYVFPIIKNKSDVAFMIGNALPPDFIKQQALLVKGLL